MKKFIKNIVLFALSAVVFVELLCVFADPFNVFHPYHLRNNGIEPNKNYIKMKYLLKNPDKFDALLFGSSRVGNIHVENMKDNKCYNMTYSVGLPKEHLDNIRTLFENGIFPKVIYIGVDDVSYRMDPSEHLTEPLRCPYENIKKDPVQFVKLYLNPAYAGSAFIENAGSARMDNFRDRFYETGWNYDYGFESGIYFSEGSPEEVKARIYGTLNTDPDTPVHFEETLQELEETKELCEENGVELVIFVNPMLYAQQVDANYLEFLKRLAEITPYWNFGGYNDLIYDDSNYIDDSHVSAETSDLIIRCMCNGEKIDGLYEHGFGRYITKDNVDDLLPVLSGQKAF